MIKSVQIKRAVFSFITWRTSGIYPHWDDFPRVISRHLKKENIDHLCFYRDYSTHSKYPLGQRYQVSHAQMANPFEVKKLIGPLTKKYDEIIFHHHTYSFPCGLWIYNNIFNKRFHWIITDHNSWDTIKFSRTKRVAKKLLRNFGLLPEVIIGCSKASKKRLQQLYGVKGVDFIYNGSKFSDVPIPKKFVSKPTKALFVGRLEEYKGLWVLAQAMKIIKARGDNVRLTIVGDGPLRKPLQEYIRLNRLKNYINMVGHSFTVSDFYSKSDFIIMPSTYEDNCPMTSLESQAYHLPCIYTPSGGIPETQINGKTGIMIAKNNPQEIVKAIRSFQRNIGRFNQMRTAARKNSLRFTLNKMAQNYVSLYLGLLER